MINNRTHSNELLVGENALNSDINQSWEQDNQAWWDWYVTLADNGGMQDGGPLVELPTTPNVDLPTNDDVAGELGMSRRSLHRRLHEKGTSFRIIRSDIMIRAAKESLVSGSQSVTRLAQDLGCSDASAFNRFFLKRAGVTPPVFGGR